MIPDKRRLSSRVGLCAGLALSLATVASAQPIFESTFPGGGSDDAARGGVLLTQDGGTISVGQSLTFGSGDYDVYVVKTDACGFLEWSSTYNFGGHDYGRKIRQDANGDYIIVGATHKSDCCDDPVSADVLDADIFLLKIDGKGQPYWAKTYGGSSFDDASDVQLYIDGGYVVTGSTQSFGDAKINGYLMRTDAGGNVIWGRSFGQRLTDLNTAAEYLNSCTVTAKGDILAVGVTYSFGGTHILAIRTNPDGYSDAPFGWVNIYPSRGAGNARHIIESFDGTFVIAGSLVTPETGTQDGYLLRIDGAGTSLFGMAYGEGFLKFPDDIAEVRETVKGHLIFTGYTTDAPGGFGGQDLLLCEVDYNFGQQWSRVHGGKLDDEGFSIAYDPVLSEKYGSVFVTANGVTRSFTGGDEDLYLLQAIKDGYTNCNEAYIKLNDYPRTIENKAVSYCHPLVRVQCFAKVGFEYNFKQNLLCTSCGHNQERDDDPFLGQMDRDVRSNGLNSQNARAGSAATTVKGQTEVPTTETEGLER